MSHTLDLAQGQAVAMYNEATLKVSEGVCHTLRARTSAGGVPDCVAIPEVAAFSAGQSEGAGTLGYQVGVSPTLRGAASGTNQVPTAIIPEVSNALTYDARQHHNPQPSDTVQITTLNCAFVRGDTPLVQAVAHSLTRRMDSSEDGTGRGTPLVAVSVHQNADGEVRTYATSNTLNTNSNATGRNAPIVMAPAFSKRPGQQIATRDDGSSFALTSGEPPRVLAFGLSNQPTPKYGEEVCPSLDAKETGGGRMEAVAQGYAVRRLTPLECERLQGFPDGWTDVPYRGKQAADGPRYKAIGNSMAVNVMRFIGERIAAVEEETPPTFGGVQASVL